MFLKCVVIPVLLGGTACRSLGQIGPDVYPTVELELEHRWRLDTGGRRFDASGIERGPGGELLLVRDTELGIYSVRPDEASETARIQRDSRYRVQRPLRGVGGSAFDIEGLAMSPGDGLYACDERERRVLRILEDGRVENVPIDLEEARQFFNINNRNASFEGIAVGDSKLYIANERTTGRIFEWDLNTGELLKHFVARTGTSAWPDAHYSGLDWFDGHLYALLREERAIVEIDPIDGKVKRVFRYHSIESAKENRYRTVVPLVGVMEGVLVEGDMIWLLSDNNGQGRVADRADTRPSLFRCRIPKQEQGAGD